MMTRKNRVALHILVVDDDPDDKDLFEEALKEISPDIHYLEAANGIDALNVLEKLKVEGLPDYIFLDLNMPQLNGKQCLQRIMEDEVLQDIPTIIYTTSAREEDIQELKKIGAAFFLTKPDKFNDLKNAISYIIDGHKLQIPVNAKNQWEK